jgi:hypothetical protein
MAGGPGSVSQALRILLSVISVFWRSRSPGLSGSIGRCHRADRVDRVALATVVDPRNHPLLDVSADDFIIRAAPHADSSAGPPTIPSWCSSTTAGRARRLSLMRRAVLPSTGWSAAAGDGTLGDRPAHLAEDDWNSDSAARRIEPDTTPGARCCRVSRLRVR